MFARLWPSRPIPSPTSASRAPAFAALLFTMALWGSNTTVAKLMLGVYGPYTLTWLRWLVVLAITAPFAWQERAALRTALRSHWLPLLLLALLGGMLQNSLVFSGLNHSTAVHLGLLNSAVPVFILLLGWMLMGQRLHTKEFIGVFISAAGVLVILFQGNPAGLLRMQMQPGDPVMLAGMVLWALYTLNLNRRPTTISLSVMMFVIAVISLPLGLPLALGELSSRPLPPFAWLPFAGLIYMSAGTTLFSMVLYGYGIKRIGPAQASVFIHVMPLFACLFATLFGGESLYLYHAAGFVLVASGAIISCYRSAPAANAASK